MYGLLIASGILIAVLFSEKLARAKNLDGELFWHAVFWTIAFGTIGARLYHVVDFWEIYGTNLWLIPQVWRGGLGIFGALIAGVIFLALFFKKHRQNVWVWLDVFALPIPFAQAVGRLGNYFNRELMPYAIYEAVANLLLFFVLFIINRKFGGLSSRKNKLQNGGVFAFYIIGYSTLRFALEPFRTNAWTIAGLNVAQIISILLMLAAAAVLIKRQGSQD